MFRFFRSIRQQLERLMAMVFVLLSGCSTNQPLSIQSDGPALASQLGTNTQDILFLSYGGFRRLHPRFLEQRLRLHSSYVVLTNTELAVIPTSGSSANNRFALSEITAVSRKGNQIRLKLPENEILLVIGKVPRSPDSVIAYQLLEHLKALKIPEFHSDDRLVTDWDLELPRNRYRGTTTE